MASAAQIAVELLPPLADPPPTVELARPRVPVPRPADPMPVVAPPPTLTPPPYIPHDVPPRLVNVEEVRRALADGVPAELAEEAAEGRVTLWLFVDETGRVRKLRVQGSSGVRALDDLAVRVARTMAYRPALNGGLRVGVWVSQPIRFARPDPDRP